MSDELREKVARVLANAMGEIGDDVWKFYLREADAAIALVSGEQAARIEQLEAALRPLACTCKAAHQADCSRSEVDCPFWTARAALDAPA